MSDAEIPNDRITRRTRHTVLAVYSHMVQEICRLYRVLPPVDEMTLTDIGFWYDGIRAELKAATKPPKNRRTK